MCSLFGVSQSLQFTLVVIHRRDGETTVPSDKVTLNDGCDMNNATFHKKWTQFSCRMTSLTEPRIDIISNIVRNTETNWFHMQKKDSWNTNAMRVVHLIEAPI